MARSGFGGRLVHAWNAFTKNDSESRMSPRTQYWGNAFGREPYRQRLTISNERSIISSIYTRIAVDVSGIDIKHVRLDEQGRYLSDVDSGLNNCLTLEANIDQAARAFILDMVMTLLDKGVAVFVPVDTTINPELSGGYDILNMRIGEVVTWFPQHVRVSVYNEQTGQPEEVTLGKRAVAIVVNPLFQVMNEPSSTLKRLSHKLTLLDDIDDQSASGKLDIIIQLPYQVKSETQRTQAEQRRTEIEAQLKGSKYGIAYADGTEKITQLNRPAENNLMEQVKYLTDKLYTELGLTPEVMNGTADEATMLNYWNRTVEPILTAMTQAMRRNFLTKTARTQRQTVMYFRNPFKLVPIASIADIADKFSRNEIMSANEWRQILGLIPSQEPKADKLINSNMPVDKTGVDEPASETTETG